MRSIEPGISTCPSSRWRAPWNEGERPALLF